MQGVNIQTARHGFTALVPTIPIGGGLASQVAARSLVAEIQLPHEFPADIVDTKGDWSIQRQPIRQPCFGVKRVRKVLIQRCALDLSKRCHRQCGTVGKSGPSFTALWDDMTTELSLIPIEEPNLEPV